MYKELEGTIRIQPSDARLPGELGATGVLLLNTVLTVRAGQAHSHASLGWETFTDKVISLINEHREGVVFYCGAPMPRKRGDYRRATSLRAESTASFAAFRPSRLLW